MHKLKQKLRENNVFYFKVNIMKEQLSYFLILTNTHLYYLKVGAGPGYFF